MRRPPAPVDLPRAPSSTSSRRRHHISGSPPESPLALPLDLPDLRPRASDRQLSTGSASLFPPLTQQSPPWPLPNRTSSSNSSRLSARDNDEPHAAYIGHRQTVPSRGLSVDRPDRQRGVHSPRLPSLEAYPPPRATTQTRLCQVCDAYIPLVELETHLNSHASPP